MDQDTVVAAVEETALLLRGDGADLILVDADPKTDRIELRLALEDANCVDCVLGPDHLHEMIFASLQRHLMGEFELVVDDPRRNDVAS